jgi:hypothetical protein
MHVTRRARPANPRKVRIQSTLDVVYQRLEQMRRPMTAIEHFVA